MWRDPLHPRGASRRLACASHRSFQRRFQFGVGDGEADEPFEISHYFPSHYIFSAARDAGVRVLLDGISGDHITAPSNYLSILIRTLRWKSAIRELSYWKKAYQEGVWSNLALYGLGVLCSPIQASGFGNASENIASLC